MLPLLSFCFLWQCHATCGGYPQISCRALHTGHWALRTGHWALGTAHWALRIGHWALGTAPRPRRASMFHDSSLSPCDECYCSSPLDHCISVAADRQGRAGQGRAGQGRAGRGGAAQRSALSVVMSRRTWTCLARSGPAWPRLASLVACAAEQC